MADVDFDKLKKQAREDDEADRIVVEQGGSPMPSFGREKAADSPWPVGRIKTREDLARLGLEVASMSPVGQIYQAAADSMIAVMDFTSGDYLGAGISAAMAPIPFIGAGAAKRAVKGAMPDFSSASDEVDILVMPFVRQSELGEVIDNARRAGGEQYAQSAVARLLRNADDFESGRISKSLARDNARRVVESTRRSVTPIKRVETPVSPTARAYHERRVTHGATEGASSGSDYIDPELQGFAGREASDVAASARTRFHAPAVPATVIRGLNRKAKEMFPDAPGRTRISERRVSGGEKSVEDYLDPAPVRSQQEVLPEDVEVYGFLSPEQKKQVRKAWAAESDTNLRDIERYRGEWREKVGTDLSRREALETGWDKKWKKQKGIRAGKKVEKTARKEQVKEALARAEKNRVAIVEKRRLVEREATARVTAFKREYREQLGRDDIIPQHTSSKYREALEVLEEQRDSARKSRQLAEAEMKLPQEIGGPQGAGTSPVFKRREGDVELPPRDLPKLSESKD